MLVRVAVPRRQDGGQRDRLWDFCRGFWNQWDVVEGHHEDGPFNRSAAINEAASGKWDLLVIADSDVVIDMKQVADAISMASERGCMVLPYSAGRRMMMPEEATLRALEEGFDEMTWLREAIPDPYAAHSSSVVVVRRDLWDRVGGFDERFVGWGGEDDAFAAACQCLGGRVRVAGEVWHLWHEPMKGRSRAEPAYLDNKRLAQRYMRAARRPVDMMKILGERGIVG